jgi:thymidine kinase
MAKLYFYYSAMNAGKSTTLLQSAHNYHERGMETIIFTPMIDDRDQIGIISSRIGLSAKAFPFDADHDFYKHLHDELANRPIHCVLIDEAQFLTPQQVLQLTMVCDLLGIPVLCYGIRTDFRGEPFEGSKYLLAWADEMTEIKTICHSGRKATMNARIDADGNRVVDGDQIQIGHNYLSVSRAEFDLPRVSPIGYAALQPNKQHS